MLAQRGTSFFFPFFFFNSKQHRQMPNSVGNVYYKYTIYNKCNLEKQKIQEIVSRNASGTECTNQRYIWIKISVRNSLVN